MKEKNYDAVIIGGGVVGCAVARHVKKYARDVLILEKEEEILMRASFTNQARVHNGYHYPRSFLTAQRSRIDSQLFVDEFRSCIYDSFNTYYAIAKNYSKVNAIQFTNLCKRIDAPIRAAEREIKKIFNSDLVEEVYLAEEYVYDALKLRQKLLNLIRESTVELETNINVIRVRPNSEKLIKVFCQSDLTHFTIKAKYVFNCTYSNTNKVLLASNLEMIPLKHELAEIAVVEVPTFLKNVGITIMCGPFFSIMPYPIRGNHTLSHVRYTPHQSWLDSNNLKFTSADDVLSKHEKTSRFPFMIKDAQRFIPMLKDCRHVDSIWEVKTLLPRSEIDDSRPILFMKNYGINNLTCVLGGKVDNIYDFYKEVDSVFC